MAAADETRLGELSALARRRRLDAVAVCTPPNVRAFSGVDCDNAVLLLNSTKHQALGTKHQALGTRRQALGTRHTSTPPLLHFSTSLFTDFRYALMVRRVAPSLKCRDLKGLKLSGRRIGYESSIPHSKFLELRKLAPRGAKFVDVARDLLEARAVKTPDELERVRAAERLTVEIWNEASARFRAGMTERDMARVVKKLMVEKGDGEAFDTIVCVGANAAECHHVPDDTVWDGREGVLVDLGVRLGGVCGDLTRNIPPKRQSALYRRVHALVAEANAAAIAAVRPGMTGRALDKVARDVIRKGGFGKCFGHSLGHGVGYEIHEGPTASAKSKWTLKPGMCLTIEPGIYLEGDLGVRIEDLVLVTEGGCEVLSRGADGPGKGGRRK